MNLSEKSKPRLVKSKTAAEYLCISERKLWELGHSDIIPIVRIGRAVLYDHLDLDKFILRCKSGGDL